MPIPDFLPATGQQRRAKELPPVSAFAADDGTAPPALAHALAQPAAQRLEAVVTALATARVLVPVVAHEETEKDADLREKFTGHRQPSGERQPSGAHMQAHPALEPGTDSPEACHDGEREASASLVTVRTPDGREALPVFSSVAALQAWRTDARPVPHQATRTAMAAIDEAGGVLVLDPGSDHPVLVPRPAVWALARGERWVPALSDPAVLADVVATLNGVAGVKHVELLPGERAEVKVSLAVVPGLTRPEVQDVAQRAAQALGESVVVAERVDSVELALITA